MIPEAIPRPAAIVSTPDPEISFSRSPVPAPSHDGGVDRGLEFAALQAKLEALELADAKRQAEFEALKSDKEKLLNKVSRATHNPYSPKISHGWYPYCLSDNRHW